MRGQEAGQCIGEPIGKGPPISSCPSSWEFNRRAGLFRVLKFNGNQTHAAEYLDISRKTLIYRMEKFGLRNEAEVSGEGQH